jgi:hypothetical protein
MNEKAILIDATPASNLRREGIVLEIDSAGCSSYQAVYCDGANSVAPADADSIDTMPAIGVLGATGQVVTHGIIRYDSWNWTAGDPVYVCTTAGSMTQTPPSGSGDIVQIIGIAVGADQLFVNPSLDWVEVA